VARPLGPPPPPLPLTVGLQPGGATPVLPPFSFRSPNVVFRRPVFRRCFAQGPFSLPALTLDPFDVILAPCATRASRPGLGSSVEEKPGKTLPFVFPISVV